MAATLIVEDGTGLPAANSYNSLDELAAYFSERGGDWVEYNSSVKITAAIDAAAELDLAYRWKGTIAQRGDPDADPTPLDVQGLAWPREGVCDGLGKPVKVDELPSAIKSAHAQLAALKASAYSMGDQQQQPANMTSFRLPDYGATFDLSRDDGKMAAISSMVRGLTLGSHVGSARSMPVVRMG